MIGEELQCMTIPYGSRCHRCRPQAPIAIQSQNFYQQPVANHLLDSTVNAPKALHSLAPHANTNEVVVEGQEVAVGLKTCVSRHTA
jgi:hypothetical protein